MNTKNGRFIGVVLLALSPLASLWVLSLPASADDAAGPATSQGGFTTTQLDSMLEQVSIGQIGPEFNADEYAALDKDLDNTKGYNEQGFYVLLRHVMADLKAEEANPVTVQTLLRQPLRYRARPVKIELRLNGQPKEVLSPRPEPYEKFYSTSAFVDVPNSAPQAVFVITPFKPADMTDKQRFETVGYFYKLMKTDVPGGGTTQVPVIVASQINPVGSATAKTNTVNMGLVMAVVGLVIVYIFVRTKLSRKSAPASTYRPRRFELTPEEDAQSRVNIEPNDPPKDQPK